MANSEPATPIPATSTETTEPPKKRIKVKRKPARKQVEVGQVQKKAPEQTGQVYNLWYHKWAGGDRYDAYNVKEKSQTRCSIENDAGYTQADGGNNSYCCLYFARGCCSYGSECSYLHRLPPPQHILPDASKDVFGREKFADYRDDMGGVGSFNRQNRTLYVGRIKEKKGMEEIVQQHFSEWGEIERIRILQGRSVAFVTYVNELQAQFAKESMMCQSLDEDEVLNVRWATEDPNPVAKVSEKRRLEDVGQEAISKRLPPSFIDAVRDMDNLESLLEGPDPQNDDDGGADDGRPAAKRQRIEISHEEETTPRVPNEPPPVPSLGVGLLSGNAMDSLRWMAARKQDTEAVSRPPNPKNALMGLADYGSDDDD